MRERLYLNQRGPRGGVDYLDVCTCGGVLQVRLTGQTVRPAQGGAVQVRVELKREDLERMREFFEECDTLVREREERYGETA